MIRMEVVPCERSNLPAISMNVLVSEEDEAGAAWSHGVAREWAEELGDSREDLYTLADGHSLDAGR